ncbi:MAG: DUF997 family protein [Lachnospiraceae bacterium]|nr:DUF997 family protein [Lachnospiraceae bacterium]
MEDKFSCDYDSKQVKNDPRFLECRKDMVLVQVVYLGYTVLLILLAYCLCPEDISQMAYAFGLPLWVAVALALTIASVIFVIIWALTRKQFSLEAKDGKSEEE